MQNFKVGLKGGLQWNSNDTSANHNSEYLVSVTFGTSANYNYEFWFLLRLDLVGFELRMEEHPRGCFESHIVNKTRPPQTREPALD